MSGRRKMIDTCCETCDFNWQAEQSGDTYTYAPSMHITACVPASMCPRCANMVMDIPDEQRGWIHGLIRVALEKHLETADHTEHERPRDPMED